MKFSLKKAAAAIVLAGALAVAAPAAASASGYTPEGPDGTITLAAGGTVTVPFTDFGANEVVTFTLTGESALGALSSIVRTAIETDTATRNADAQGNASIDVTLPANASGTYTLEAFSDSASAAPVTIEVASSAGGGTGSLPDTGSDGALMLGLWVGGGALLLAGGAVVVATTVRRQRQHS